MTVDFLNALRRSELLSPEDIAELVRAEQLATESDPKNIARAFIKQGRLTLYQANQLLHGQTRGFFIDRYTLRDVLGVGGMGWVFLAKPRDGQGEPPVVIKVLTDQTKHDPGMRARFELEARAGLQLRHENIVRTLKFGQADDLYGEFPYMVMEFVEGITLWDLMRLQKAPLKWPQAADCIRQAADGLHYAHQRGMIHRDIKSTNLLITRDGQVKILDFGLALLQNDDQSEFSLAMIFGHQGVGTADFMAPEQRVDSHAVDARADIYSLGCTLYHLLVGSVPRTPPRSPEVEVPGSAGLPPVREKVPDVPEELARILTKMVMIAPEERFSSAAEVSRALAPFGERREVPFDFAQILKLRASETRKLLPRRSSTSNPSSSVLKPSGISLSTPQAMVDTRVTSDTSPRLSAVATPAPSGPGGPATELPGFNRLNDDDSPRIRTVEQVKLMLAPVPAGPPIRLDRERMVIGRAPGSAIHLDAPSVSSRHAELSLDGQWWRIRDLNSRNGIRVNGVATTDQLLWPGDRISIAEQFHFVLMEIRPSKKRFPWWMLAALAGMIALAGAGYGMLTLFE